MPATSSSECRLCMARQSLADIDSLSEMGPPYVIAETEGYAVACERNPLAPGHTLLIPEEHVAAFSLLSHQRLRQAERLIARIADGFHDIASNTTLLVERGNNKDSGHHAALHLIPSSGHTTGWVQQFRPHQLAKVWNLTDLHDLGSGSYIFTQQFAKTGNIWDPEQFSENWLDRIISDELGEDEWNWRDRLQTRGPEIRSDAIRANLAIVLTALGRRPHAPQKLVSISGTRSQGERTAP